MPASPIKFCPFLLQAWHRHNIDIFMLGLNVFNPCCDMSCTWRVFVFGMAHNVAKFCMTIRYPTRSVLSSWSPCYAFASLTRTSGIILKINQHTCVYVHVLVLPLIWFNCIFTKLKGQSGLFCVTQLI